MFFTLSQMEKCAGVLVTVALPCVSMLLPECYLEVVCGRAAVNKAPWSLPPAPDHQARRLAAPEPGRQQLLTLT